MFFVREKSIYFLGDVCGLGLEGGILLLAPLLCFYVICGKSLYLAPHKNPSYCQGKAILPS